MASCTLVPGAHWCLEHTGAWSTLIMPGGCHGLAPLPVLVPVASSWPEDGNDWLLTPCMDLALALCTSATAMAF